MNNLAKAIVCLGLTYFGFEYDSGFAFCGAIIALMPMTE